MNDQRSETLTYGHIWSVQQASVNTLSEFLVRWNRYHLA